MSRTTGRMSAALLAAAMGISSIATAPVTVSAAEKPWYEEVEWNVPQMSLHTEDRESVPSAEGSTEMRNRKGGTSVPSAYMNTLAQLTQEYPQTHNQGNYATCWAFSATGLAEFDLIHDDKVADKSIDLSEVQLAYFSYNNQEDAFGGTFGDSFKVSGNYLTSGNLYYASRTLLQWEGLIPESEAPYAKAAETRSLGKEYAFDKDVAHLQNAYVINLHKDAASVKKEIMAHGAAGVGYYADETGIFSNTAVYDKTGENVATYYCPYSGKSYLPNHAVNIVGWDDNFPASAFKNQPAGNGAWLIRNSWSETAENSENSYFWLSYYDKTLEDEAWIFDFEPADNYDYNYQYDGCSYVYKAMTCPTTANVFKTQGAANELLRAVSITLNEDVNVPYTIKVYTNLASPSKPRSGVLAAKVSGQTSYAGTYTVPLNKAVSIPKGTYYSVVVELGKGNTGIDMECSGSGNGFTAKAYADFNQSLVYYNGRWEDLAEAGSFYRVGNLCIKSFTDKADGSIGKVEKAKSSSVTRKSAKISWSGVSSAEGYEVYRATSKNGTYKKLATVKSKSYTDKTCKAGKTYYYKVRAYKNAKGTKIQGKLSSAVSVKTKK